MVVAEVLTGIALLKSATSAIKDAIDTGKEATGIMKMVHQCPKSTVLIRRSERSPLHGKHECFARNHNGVGCDILNSRVLGVISSAHKIHTSIS